MLNLISVFVLHKAFNRIAVITKQNGLEVNIKMMRIHLTAFCLSVLSLLLLMIANITDTRFLSTFVTILLAVTIAMSEILLSIVFLIIS